MREVSVQIFRRVMILAVAVLTMATLARAQQLREATPDDVCAMVAGYAKMGVGHAAFAPLLASCGKSERCIATRLTMIIASRTDFDTLACEHAPPPDARDACAVLKSQAFVLAYMVRPDNTQSSPLVRQQVEQDVAKLASACNTSPDPELPCQALDELTKEKLLAPELACKR